MSTAIAIYPSSSNHANSDALRTLGRQHENSSRIHIHSHTAAMASSPAGPLGALAAPAPTSGRAGLDSPGEAPRIDSPTDSRTCVPTLIRLANDRPTKISPRPRVEVKTEQNRSPTEQTAGRRRPQRLDLNGPTASKQSAPLTAAKESGSLSALHDVATACLSPGFEPSDPKMRQQMERSRDLAEQQRQIIMARQKGGAGAGTSSASNNPGDLGPPPSSFSKPLGTSRRKAPPSMLSISGQHAPEPRVVQSAPLNQTFTGLHRPIHPLSRQVLDHSHAHNNHHSHHDPGALSPQAPLSANRLPPISDLVRSDEHPREERRPLLDRSNSGPGERIVYTPVGVPESPSLQQPGNGHREGAASSKLYYSSHPRPEVRSADEAVQSIEGSDVHPKVVYYGGRQPPTPNSPHPGAHGAAYDHSPHGFKHDVNPTGTARRRTREEYERDQDAVHAEDAEREHRLRRERERERERDRERGDGAGLGFGFGAWNGGPGAANGHHHGTDNLGRRRSPESVRRRREEFMALCARAWDLLHE